MATYVPEAYAHPPGQILVYRDGHPRIFRTATADRLASWLMFGDAYSEHWCQLYRERDEQRAFVLVHFGTYDNTLGPKRYEYREAEVIAPGDALARLLADDVPVPVDLEHEACARRPAGSGGAGRIELHLWQTHK